MCAGDQKKFWEMHDLIFQNMQSLDVDSLKKHAQKLGLKTSKFNECVDSGKFKDAVEKEMNEGSSVGIRGTPGFVVGKVDHKNKTVTGKIISGAYPYQTFKEQIDQLLSASN